MGLKQALPAGDHALCDATVQLRRTCTTFSRTLCHSAIAQPRPESHFHHGTLFHPPRPRVPLVPVEAKSGLPGMAGLSQSCSEPVTL